MIVSLAADGGFDPSRHPTLAIVVGVLAIASGVGFLWFPDFFDMWPTRHGAPLWWRWLSSVVAVGIGIWLVVAGNAR